MTIYYLVDRPTQTIVGSTDLCTPLGSYKAYPGPEKPIDALYFDGEIVQEKPLRPSSRHFWDTKEHQWQELEIRPTGLFLTNWDGLLQAIEALPAWDKTVSASEESLKVNTAFTLFMSLILSIKDTARLEPAFQRLRSALAEISEDFTEEEIGAINKALSDNNFGIQLA